MAEYIERDKIAKWLRRVARLLKATENHKGKTKLIGQIIDHINKTSIADVVEVVHGRNLKEDTPSLFECSVCHWECWDTIPGDTDTYNYCPNCGERMDGADVQNT